MISRGVVSPPRPHRRPGDRARGLWTSATSARGRNPLGYITKETEHRWGSGQTLHADRACRRSVRFWLGHGDALVVGGWCGPVLKPIDVRSCPGERDVAYTEARRMMAVPTTSKKRGRPRAYDPEHALDAALDVFWMQGFDGTSLEDLRRATGMNRPSLAAAFGDKRAIFLRTLARFRARVCADGAGALEAAPSVEGKLESFYGTLIQHYGPNARHPARGCMLLGAAAVLAPTDPDVAAELTALLDEVHAVLLGVFKDAQAGGEIPNSASPRELAWLAAAVQHSLSTRARSGASKRQLSSFARVCVRQVLRAAAC